MRKIPPAFLLVAAALFLPCGLLYIYQFGQLQFLSGEYKNIESPEEMYAAIMQELTLDVSTRADVFDVLNRHISQTDYACVEFTEVEDGEEYRLDPNDMSCSIPAPATYALYNPVEVLLCPREFSVYFDFDDDRLAGMDVQLLDTCT